MKQLTTFCISLILCISSVFAQSYDTTQFYGKNNFLFQHIDKTPISTGLLRDYGIDFQELDNYTGVALHDSNFTSLSDWRMLYGSIYSQQISSTAGLLALDTLNKRFSNYGIVGQPISFVTLYYNYQSIDPNALANDQFFMDNNQLYDVGERSGNPYLSHEVFAVATTRQVATVGDNQFNFRSLLYLSNTGKTISTVDLVHEEDLKATTNNQIYVQHTYPNKKPIMKFEYFGPLDFANKDYGYPNPNGSKDVTVRKEYNATYNPDKDARNAPLFTEFMTGRGAENSIIIGGKMLEDIKNLSSVKSMIQSGINKILKDGKIEAGETASEYHTMTYTEGMFDIWIPSIFVGRRGLAGEDPSTSTQHFLGSFNLRIDILEDGKTALFTLSDSKSLESLTDHQNKGSSKDRKSGEKVPFSSTYQRYLWTAPISSTPKTN